MKLPYKEHLLEETSSDQDNTNNVCDLFWYMQNLSNENGTFQIDTKQRKHNH